MAVKSTQDGDKIILELDNGDAVKLEEVMKKWSFKDHQSFLRFAMSLHLVNEGRSFSITQKGVPSAVEPVAELLKSQDSYE